MGCVKRRVNNACHPYAIVRAKEGHGFNSTAQRAIIGQVHILGTDIGGKTVGSLIQAQRTARHVKPRTVCPATQRHGVAYEFGDKRGNRRTVEILWRADLFDPTV